MIVYFSLEWNWWKRGSHWYFLTLHKVVQMERLKFCNTFWINWLCLSKRAANISFLKCGNTFMVTANGNCGNLTGWEQTAEYWDLRGSDCLYSFLHCILYSYHLMPLIQIRNLVSLLISDTLVRYFCVDNFLCFPSLLLN